MARRVGITCAVLLLVLTGCRVARAQPAGPGGYRHLSGSLALGWLDTETTDLFAGSTNNPFAAISFDYRDAIIDPAFINYRVQPTFGKGFQDLFGTASPRTGAAAEVNFLPARPFPLRLYYSRFRRSTLAASSQYYGKILAQSDDTLAGLQWRLLVPDWPTLDLSASDSNVTTTPEEVLNAGYSSHSRTLALNASDARWGWTFDGNIQLQRLDAERLGASASGPVSFDTMTNLRALRALARRDLGRWFSLYLNASGTQSDNRLADGYLSQQYGAYSGRVLFQPTARFSTWVEGRLTASELEGRSADAAGGPGFVIPRTETTNRIADLETRYVVLRGVDLLGRLEFTDVSSSSTGTPAEAFSVLNTVGGVQFQRRVGWSDVSGSYTMNRYRRRDGGASDSDQIGHAVDVSASLGSPRMVRATVGYSLSRSTQEVRATLPYVSNGQRVRLALEKALGPASRVELHWDVTDTTYESEDLRSEYSGQGYGGALTVRRLTVSFDHGYGSGDSVQQAFDLASPAALAGPPIFIAGSDNEHTTAGLHWQVNSTLSLRGAWRDQRQALGGLQTSRVEQREVMLRYNFRRIAVEGGHVFYRFDFGSPVYRRSLMFRIVRDFQWF